MLTLNGMSAQDVQHPQKNLFVANNGIGRLASDSIGSNVM